MPRLQEVIAATCLEGKTVSVDHLPADFYLRLKLTFSRDSEFFPQLLHLWRKPVFGQIQSPTSTPTRRHKPERCLPDSCLPSSTVRYTAARTLRSSPPTLASALSSRISTPLCSNCPLMYLYAYSQVSRVLVLNLSWNSCQKQNKRRARFCVTPFGSPHRWGSNTDSHFFIIVHGLQ